MSTVPPQWSDSSTDDGRVLPRTGAPAARCPCSPHRAVTRKGAIVRKLLERFRRDDGMTTAEYAMGLVAAVAFAGILYKVVTSGVVMTALTAVVKGALSQR